MNKELREEVAELNRAIDRLPTKRWWRAAIAAFTLAFAAVLFFAPRF